MREHALRQMLFALALFAAICVAEQDPSTVRSDSALVHEMPATETEELATPVPNTDQVRDPSLAGWEALPPRQWRNSKGKINLDQLVDVNQVVDEALMQVKASTSTAEADLEISEADFEAPDICPCKRPPCHCGPTAKKGSRPPRSSPPWARDTPPPAAKTQLFGERYLKMDYPPFPKWKPHKPLNGPRVRKPKAQTAKELHRDVHAEHVLAKDSAELKKLPSSGAELGTLHSLNPQGQPARKPKVSQASASVALQATKELHHDLHKEHALAKDIAKDAAKLKRLPSAGYELGTLNGLKHTVDAVQATETTVRAQVQQANMPQVSQTTRTETPAAAGLGKAARTRLATRMAKLKSEKAKVTVATAKLHSRMARVKAREQKLGRTAKAQAVEAKALGRLKAQVAAKAEEVHEKAERVHEQAERLEREKSKEKKMAEAADAMPHEHRRKAVPQKHRSRENTERLSRTDSPPQATEEAVTQEDTAQEAAAPQEDAAPSRRVKDKRHLRKKGSRTSYEDAIVAAMPPSHPLNLAHRHHATTLRKRERRDDDADRRRDRRVIIIRDDDDVKRKLSRKLPAVVPDVNRMVEERTSEKPEDRSLDWLSGMQKEPAPDMELLSVPPEVQWESTAPPPSRLEREATTLEKDIGRKLDRVAHQVPTLQATQDFAPPPQLPTLQATQEFAPPPQVPTLQATQDFTPPPLPAPKLRQQQMGRFVPLPSSSNGSPLYSRYPQDVHALKERQLAAQKAAVLEQALFNDLFQDDQY